MEAELTCPVCNKPFVNPVVLPCSHSVCLTCSQSALTTSGADNPPVSSNGSGQVESEETPYVTLYDMNHLYQSIGNLPCLKCPTCKKLFPLDGRGVNGFPATASWKILSIAIMHNQMELFIVNFAKKTNLAKPQ